MNSLFKFPRRVRIHGGECGAVARALHHKAQKVALTQNEQSLISDEKALLRQAVFKKSLKTTFIERKQMSTKTLRKRIALVAVSALGFGLVGAAPSSAAIATSTVSVVSPTITVTTGTTASTVVNLISSVATDLDTLVITPTLLSSPNDSTMVVDANDTLIAGEFGLNLTGAAAPYSTLDTVSGGVITLTDPATAGVQLTATTTATGLGTFSTTPSAPGTYVYRVSVNSTAASTVDITVLALPSTTSGSAIAATQTAANGVAAEPNTITVARIAGAATDGAILGQFTVSADATDAPLTTVFGKVVGTTDLAAVTVGGTTATPTFVVARTNLAAGSYTVTFWVDANSNGTYQTTETSTTVTFTVGGALSTISVAISNPIRSNVAGHQSFTVTATVADADGGASAGTLFVSESSSTGAAYSTTYTNIANNTSLSRVGTTNTYVGTFAIDTDAAAATGSNLLYVTVADANDLTVTATKRGTASIRIVRFADLDATDALTANSAVGIGTIAATGVKNSVIAAAGETRTITVDPAIASITFTGKAAAAQAGEYIFASVAPKVGTSCIASASAYALVLADLSFSYTVAKTCVEDDGYTVTFTGTNTAAATVTFADSAPTWTVSPAAYKTVFGSTNTLVASLSDQYGRPTASKAVVASVTGRNVASTSYTTNAAGQVTWTATDASASTLLLTDTVTFTYNYTNSAGTNTAAAGSRVITYAATAIAVGSIALIEDNAANSQTIDQVRSTPGVPAAFTTYTASLKTALGAPVTSGVLVTFTGGADDLFYGSSVGVTDANGQASVAVYRNKIGFASITATAGGVSSPVAGLVEYVNLAVDARNITIKAEPASVVSAGTSTITATVTDRWGNPVSAIAVTFAELGAGRLTATAATTNTAGIASVDFTSNAGETGTNTVSVLINTAAQSTNPAGFVGAVAVAGVTAGNRTATTPVTITADTSVSTADALLELAKAIGTGKSVEEAADAAAEAIDAANAATDAANLAAEAADAATVAAEEARDAADAATAAVEELATQVASLMSALKAQLTTLANTVAKIAKKVKA